MPPYTGFPVRHHRSRLTSSMVLIAYKALVFLHFPRWTMPNFPLPRTLVSSKRSIGLVNPLPASSPLHAQIRSCKRELYSRQRVRSPAGPFRGHGSPWMGGVRDRPRRACKKTKTFNAIEIIKPVSCDGWKEEYPGREDGACACRREFPANGCTLVHQRFDGTVVLGEEGFGIVHCRRCKKTKESTDSRRSQR